MEIDRYYRRKNSFSDVSYAVLCSYLNQVLVLVTKVAHGVDVLYVTLLIVLNNTRYSSLNVQINNATKLLCILGP